MVCPQAHSIRIFWCADPIGCGRPHVVLQDDRGMPLAQFVVPVNWPEHLLEADRRGPPDNIKEGSQWFD
jgi:hypothetical protein